MTVQVSEERREWASSQLWPAPITSKALPTHMHVTRFQKFSVILVYSCFLQLLRLRFIASANVISEPYYFENRYFQQKIFANFLVITHMNKCSIPAEYSLRLPDGGDHSSVNFKICVYVPLLRFAKNPIISEALRSEWNGDKLRKLVNSILLRKAQKEY